MSFCSFIFERGKVRKKEGGHSVPSYCKFFQQSRALSILEPRRLGSPFLFVLPLFLAPLGLDPAEPPRASGEGGPRLGLPALLMPLLKVVVPAETQPPVKPGHPDLVTAATIF